MKQAHHLLMVNFVQPAKTVPCLPGKKLSIGVQKNDQKDEKAVYGFFHCWYLYFSKRNPNYSSVLKAEAGNPSLLQRFAPSGLSAHAYLTAAGLFISSLQTTTLL